MQVTLELMWSFVVQNFYHTHASKTRRSMALKKLYWSDFYPTLVKYNSTRFYFKSSTYLNTYYWLHVSLFRKSFWGVFSTLTYKNQGILYNNITLSYYHKTIVKLAVSNNPVFEPLKTVDHFVYLEPYIITLLPFNKTTFNSLVYTSYFLLTTYYSTHPMWFKLLHTYTWLCKFFSFDIALNTFYFKVHKY